MNDKRYREETFEILYNNSQKVLKANYEQGVEQTEVVMEVIKVLGSSKQDRAEIARKLLMEAWGYNGV